MKGRCLIGVAVIVAWASGAFAQTAESRVLRAATASPAPQASSFGLPVSVERIRRELAVTRAVDPLNLRLEYYVEVYGRPLRLDDLFPEEDLTRGQVPYAGLTHREFVGVLTPEEFKSPPMDFANLARVIERWLRGRGGKE